MSEKDRQGSSRSDENQEDKPYVPSQRHRERRNSSLASIGSNILEEIIEGAIWQETAKVLEGAQFDQEGCQSTTTTTSASTFSPIQQQYPQTDRLSDEREKGTGT